MTIAGLSSITPIQPRDPGLSTRQKEDDAGYQLGQALQSGDLAGAQAAYSALASFGPNNSGPWKNPAISAEFATLGQQIQSGDISGAKNTFNQIGKQQLSSDFNAYLKNATTQNLQNLQGDFFAVTGTQLQQDPPSSGASTVVASPTAGGLNFIA